MNVSKHLIKYYGMVLRVSISGDNRLPLGYTYARLPLIIKKKNIMLHYPLLKSAHVLHQAQ